MAGKRHRRVRDAVHVAEATTGLQFCAYLGPAQDDARALAERLFAEAQPAVLLVVAPDVRRVEILTAPSARDRVPDDACRDAIARMTPALQGRRFDDALVTAIEHLASVAGPGAPSDLAQELPDLFDET